MTYKPKAFTVSALGYYDGLYCRPSNPSCVPEAKRDWYHWAYIQGINARYLERRAKSYTTKLHSVV